MSLGITSSSAATRLLSGITVAALAAVVGASPAAAATAPYDAASATPMTSGNADVHQCDANAETGAIQANVSASITMPGPSQAECVAGVSAKTKSLQGDWPYAVAVFKINKATVSTDHFTYAQDPRVQGCIVLSPVGAGGGAKTYGRCNDGIPDHPYGWPSHPPTFPLLPSTQSTSGEWTVSVAAPQGTYRAFAYLRAVAQNWGDDEASFAPDRRVRATVDAVVTSIN